MRIASSSKIKSRIAVTPKGLSNTAQGCEPRATVGKPASVPSNPIGVASQCFRCDGSGHLCNTCGESKPACDCASENVDLVRCPDCDGTGK